MRSSYLKHAAVLQFIAEKFAELSAVDKDNASLLEELSVHLSMMAARLGGNARRDLLGSDVIH